MFSLLVKNFNRIRNSSIKQWLKYKVYILHCKGYFYLTNFVQNRLKI
ncbi:MAG: hypothetical protein ACI9VN_002853 [Patescibacteria group bacterium]|jgi:hypothetical protein